MRVIIGQKMVIRVLLVVIIFLLKLRILMIDLMMKSILMIIISHYREFYFLRKFQLNFAVLLFRMIAKFDLNHFDIL